MANVLSENQLASLVALMEAGDWLTVDEVRRLLDRQGLQLRSAGVGQCLKGLYKRGVLDWERGSRGGGSLYRSRGRMTSNLGLPAELAVLFRAESADGEHIPLGSGKTQGVLVLSYSYGHLFALEDLPGGAESTPGIKLTAAGRHLREDLLRLDSAWLAAGH